MKLATTNGEFLRYTDHSPSLALEAYEGTGFRYIDMNFFECITQNSYLIRDDWKDEIKKCSETAERMGLTLCQAHSPSGNMFTDDAEKNRLFLECTRRSIEASAMLGIDRIVVHPILFADNEDGVPFIIKQNKIYFREVCAMLAEYGVMGMIENTSHKFKPDRTAFPCSGKELRLLLSELDSPVLHCLWDTGHGNMDGVDQYEELTAIGGELYGVHIQDNCGEQDSHMTPFSGTCSFDAVMTALRDIDYKGYFTFECGNLVRRSDAWPHLRHHFEHDGTRTDKLLNPSLELQRKAVAMMYEIGKFILTQYDCFEE